MKPEKPAEESMDLDSYLRIWGTPPADEQEAESPKLASREGSLDEKIEQLSASLERVLATQAALEKKFHKLTGAMPAEPASKPVARAAAPAARGVQRRGPRVARTIVAILVVVLVGAASALGSAVLELGSVAASETKTTSGLLVVGEVAISWVNVLLGGGVMLVAGGVLVVMGSQRRRRR